MRLAHDEIKDLLPEYLKGTASPEIKDLIEIHLKECNDCMEELGLIKAFTAAEVPDPGNLFWKTLPQKVRLAASSEKPSGFPFRWMRLRPIAAGSLLVILGLVLFARFHTKKPVEYDPLFKDPLSFEVLDYSALKEDEIPDITVKLPEEQLYGQGNFMDYGYQREFASLSAAEMETFLRVLDSEKKLGG